MDIGITQLGPLQAELFPHAYDMYMEGWDPQNGFVYNGTSYENG